MSRFFDYDEPGGVSTDTLFSTSPVNAYPFTLFGWAFLPNTPVGTGWDERCLLSLANDATFNQFFGIGVGEGTGYRVVARNTTYISTQVATPPVYDKWHAIVGVFASATDRRVYGAAADETSLQTASDSTSVSMPTLNRLGVGILADNSPNQGLGGYAQHPAVWGGVALTLAEAEMLILGRVSPLMVRPAGLAFYAPHLGRSSPERDIIGARSLTVSGPSASDLEPPMLWLPKRKKIFLPPIATGYSLSADAGVFALVGGDVALRAQRKLSADAGVFGIAGGAAALKVTRRLSVDAADFRFQGGAVGLPLGRVLRTDAGVFGITGAAVSLEAHRKLRADAAEFRFQGAAVDFSRSYRIAADAGEFRFTGGAVGFGVDRHIGIAAGDYRFAGAAVDLSIQSAAETALDVEPGDLRFQGGAVSLRASRRLDVDAADLRFSGAEVETLAQRRLSVEPGNFRINGMAVDLIAETTITLGADAGIFSIAGADVSLRLFRHLSADAGVFNISGGDVALSRDRVLKVQPGHFRISGGRARLIYSGAPPSTGADRGGVTSRVTESIVERVIAA